MDDGDGPIQLVRGRHSEDDNGQSDAASEPGQGKPGAAGGAPAGEAASASEASASIVGDGGAVSDYSRGKRLRKLARLLSSKAATQVGRDDGVNKKHALDCVQLMAGAACKWMQHWHALRRGVQQQHLAKATKAMGMSGTRTLVLELRLELRAACTARRA